MGLDSNALDFATKDSYVDDWYAFLVNDCDGYVNIHANIKSYFTYHPT